MTRHDFVIVGAGIAGAGLAAELSAHASVLIVEAEDQPGYHSTGRSAAFWSETYGGARVQPLTTASRDALDGGGFLEPLGSLHVGRDADRARCEAFLAEFDGSGIALNPVDPAEHLPGLRKDWTIGVHEPSCAYIDVGGLHAAMLGTARRLGAELRCRAGLRSADWRDGRWTLDLADGSQATAAILVNAAGAWADAVAVMAGTAPLGITPYRRTMVQLRTEPAAPAGMPHVAGLGGDFYFKPETGGRLWLSPHDESPSGAIDAAPEELDIAIAIDRFEQVVDWRVAAVEHRWAGLRSFAPDRLPVFGYDADRPSFFWCAGQGGFGIQTAPAAARLCAALLLGGDGVDVPAGIDPGWYRASRFARQPVIA